MKYLRGLPLLVAGLLLMSTPAFAADYNFETTAPQDYYGSTSYETVYGAQYNYGGINAVDFLDPLAEGAPVSTITSGGSLEYGIQASGGSIYPDSTGSAYTNEGKTIRIPTISFFSASNEIPNFNNPEEKILKPLYDRFELKVVTEYVEDRAARLAILKQKQTASNTQVPVSTISLAELEAMQAEVRNVLVPDSVNELMDDVLCELRGKGIHISDRKYFGYAPIAQAKAWLEGRDCVEPADLLVLSAYLWTAPEERTVISYTLERMCSDPLKNRLDSILADAIEGYGEFEGAADAPAARRIGKLRDEYLNLYEALEEMRSGAQSDREREKIDACLDNLEQYSRKAHEAINFSYAPLRELYALRAS